MENTNTRPFGLRDKIGYGMGDFGNDFTFMLTAMFLMKFYTDVVGVSAAVVGLLMMLARFVDAFSDVIMGQLVDRSEPGKNGKFRPWLLRFMGPVAVAALLIFAPWVKNFPMGGRIAWMFVTYILWGSVCYTAINIPYGSMASAISGDPKDRASLSTWRTIGATMAATAIGVVLPMVVYYTDEEGHTVLSSGKMFGAAVVCAICAVACYLICFFMVTERVKVPKVDTKFNLGELLKSLASNRALIGIVVAALVFLLAQLSLSGMAAYIYPNYFGSGAGQSMANLVGTVVTLVCSLFVGKLASKFGKREISIVGSLVTTVTMIVLYVMHTHNMNTFLGLYGVAYIGLAIFNLIIWAMITDVIDDTEVKTGVRQDGTIYSVYSFARKLGQAASSGLTGGLLTLIGYTAETAFDSAVTDGIYNITCIAPAIGFALLAIVMIFVYPLKKSVVEENTAKLAAKHQ